MTKKRSPAAAKKAQALATVDQPLEIFETALALLDEMRDRQDPGSQMPDLDRPFPSLMERCEHLLAQNAPVEHKLLICLDGLDPAEPEWWRDNAGGIAAQTLPPTNDVGALALHLDAFLHSEKRQGRHPLMLADLETLSDREMAPRLLRLFGKVQLLTWHPWCSFITKPKALTLDEHCRRTLRQLESVEGIQTVKFESFGPFPPRQAAGIATRFDLNLTDRDAILRRAPERQSPPVRIDGGNSYRQLCARLDYDPNSVPLPPLQSRPLRPSLQALETRLTGDPPSPTTPAQVSWFLPRLTTLGLPQPVTDDTGLRALISELDTCLEQADPQSALETLVRDMPPLSAALTLLLGAAHWLRSGEPRPALTLIGEAMERAPRTMLQLRQLAASLYSDLGQSQYALRLAAGPLLDNGILDASDPVPTGLDAHVPVATKRPVVVIAGMRHSGSTALFNTIRLGYLAMGIDPLAGYSEAHDFVAKARGSEQHVILKTHEMRDDVLGMATTVFTTVRDLRDTIASAVRRKFLILEKLNSPIEYAKYNRMLHDTWLPHSDFVFEYERFMRFPLVVTREIFEHLGIDTQFAADVVSQVASLPLDAYDTTLLSPTHITDPERKLGYQDTLTSDTVKRIESDHNLWLRTHGYAVAQKIEDRTA